VADALRIEPRDPDALAAQGRLFAAQGRLEAAAKSLGAAAASGDADSRIELARLYLRGGDFDRAREAANAVLSQTPGHPWAMAVLGQALVLEGQRDAGLAMLRRAEAARPRRPEAWLSLAEGFEAAKDPGAALRCRHAARSLREG
jgi:tetratricopeptide (TPR) repeat protein